MAKPANKLTVKQEMFCQEYLIDLNATQAAIRAGYSEKTANKNSNQLMVNNGIQDRIEELKSERSDSVAIDAKYVLNRLIEIDTLDVIDILDNSGNMKAIRDWPKAWRTSISGLDIQDMMSGDTESVIKKIKWPDKLKNIELLGRHTIIKAWEKDAVVSNITNNIMPVPSVDNIDDWESAAQNQQSEILKRVDE